MGRLCIGVRYNFRRVIMGRDVHYGLTGSIFRMGVFLSWEWEKYTCVNMNNFEGILLDLRILRDSNLV